MMKHGLLWAPKAILRKLIRFQQKQIGMSRDTELAITISSEVLSGEAREKPSARRIIRMWYFFQEFASTLISRFLIKFPSFFWPWFLGSQTVEKFEICTLEFERSVCYLPFDIQTQQGLLTWNSLALLWSRWNVISFAINISSRLCVRRLKCSLLFTDSWKRTQQKLWKSVVVWEEWTKTACLPFWAPWGLPVSSIFEWQETQTDCATFVSFMGLWKIVKSS